MTPARWPALESACLRHRLRALGLPAEWPMPPLGDAFTRLLDLPAIGPAVQQAALLAEFQGEETPARRHRFAEWFIVRLPDAEPAVLDALGPILSEIAGVPLSIRPAPAWGATGADSWRTERHEVRVAAPAVSAAPVLAAAANAVESRDALIGWIDGLPARVNELPPAEADCALAAVRAAAEGFGLAVTPRFFTFTGEWNYRELAPDELKAAKMNFDARLPAGRIVSVRQFGWEGGDDAGRTAAVAISLGPPMDDVRECIRLGMAAPQPDLEPLRAEIRQWGSRLLDGTFAPSLKDFYAALHGELGQPWRHADEAGFNQFRDALHEVLRNRCGLYPFSPAHRNEYQRHWVLLSGNAAAQTGRVRQVIQPGLLDAQQRLVLPARVEVD